MKKYKKNKILSLFALLVITLTSCDEFELGNAFLEQPPELKYSLDSAFVNAERAREVLWNAYSTLPYGHGFGKIMREERWVGLDTKVVLVLATLTKFLFGVLQI